MAGVRFLYGVGIAAWIVATAARGADGTDADALAIADAAVAAPVARHDWRGAFELAAANYTAGGQQGAVPSNDNLRMSNTLSYDRTFGAWRAIVENRLDALWRVGASRGDALDTLKEMYLSWQASPNAIVDLGRINLREGVASGFNPTDFFKAGALRSVVSIDPESLRENRLGSAMVRAQWLWQGGSATALVSPRLTGQPSDATFNPDFGATNARTRYMLSASQRLVGDFAPQWSVYGGEGISPQFGVDATALTGAATVAFAEYSIGRGPAIADGAQGARRLASKLATGFTHTFANKLTVTLEYDYDGASANRETWLALQRDPIRYARYRAQASTEQELTTRQSVFVYAQKQDAIVVHLDLTAMTRYDLVDHSYFTWMEARYHWPRSDLAVQWQSNFGAARSVFGAAAQRHVVQGVLTFYY